MKTTVFSYTLYVKGIFGRNRSVKFKGFPVAELAAPIDDAEALKLADEKLPAIKIKGQAIVKLVMNKEEIENCDGYAIRSFSLASGRTISQWAVLR